MVSQGRTAGKLMLRGAGNRPFLNMGDRIGDKARRIMGHKGKVYIFQVGRGFKPLTDEERVDKMLESFPETYLGCYDQNCEYEWLVQDIKEFEAAL